MFRNLSLAALCLSAASFAAYSAPLPEHGEICTGCHGVDGKGQAGIASMLAGLNAGYMESQLELFSSDKRHNVIMKGMADELSDPTLRAEVLQYFAQLPTWEFTDLEQRGDQADISNPYRKLVYQGDWDRNIPACSTCHGASGMGVDKFPRLASQQADYLQNQLHAWKNGTRSGDPLNMMGGIAKKLTDKEIKNLSYYFASLRYEESK
ncbi:MULTISPECIES: c-type cytochrome [Vibrio]|uniref:c-type cytochrome n=1 Tax=Vibrio TaxID=662 RepID=UPI0003A6BD9E|nr:MULTISPECIES: c-type cytochrome [Vibrio]UQA50750.1 c-type cytochrome [Vibrio sp. ED002]